MDYKDWIQNRAEELAQELYDEEFYDLLNDLQIRLRNRAEADYHDHEADKIDAAYDRAMEAQLLNQLTDD